MLLWCFQELFNSDNIPLFKRWPCFFKLHLVAKMLYFNYRNGIQLTNRSIYSYKNVSFICKTKWWLRLLFSCTHNATISAWCNKFLCRNIILDNEIYRYNLKAKVCLDPSLWYAVFNCFRRKSWASFHSRSMARWLKRKCCLNWVISNEHNQHTFP